MAFARAYDMSYDLLYDTTLAKLYAIFAAAWTITLTVGAVFLVCNRHLPSLRIRNIPLAVTAVTILHVYWILCLLAYGLNGHWPCPTEFWVMNIYLPLGIALFHASNTQLLYIAEHQQKYASMQSLSSERSNLLEHPRGWRKRLARIQSYRAVKQAMLGIGIGIIAQIAIALVIFLVSRKFHPGFGPVGESLPDTATNRIKCRHGWEWWPSIMWQFFWAWLYAPYILWRVRDIQDVHGWRKQTMVCCIAGLPASPLWLTSLYVPQMAAVNRYWIPPLWFVPPIAVMEACIIFVPCWQTIKNRKLKKEILDILAEWERQATEQSLHSRSTIAVDDRHLSHKPSFATSVNSKKAQPHLYTMTALDKALEMNATPLLLFAALKDFSGENISFLINVREWKNTWNIMERQQSISRQSSPTPINTVPETRRLQFNRAVEIYSTFISLRYSDFPINISHAHYKDLERNFAESAALVNDDTFGKSNAATPFDDCQLVPDTGLETTISKDGTLVNSVNIFKNSNDDFATNTSRKHASVISTYQMKDLSTKISAQTSIATSFGPDIFDAAEKSIMYMVLTNTWPKFVNAGYVNMLEKSSTMERLQDKVTEARTGFTRFFSMS